MEKAKAEVIRIEIASQAPFAGGKAFGAAGPYLRVTGRLRGELDPGHPANRAIADIALAPRNARGNVEYAADFELLRPADPAKGNGTLLYDVTERGDKRILHLLNDAAPGNALDAPEAAGDGFLMRHGFSIAWSGWRDALPRLPGPARPLRLDAPRAPGIEQPVWDEFLFNEAGQTVAPLSFSAATLDKAAARLTVREGSEAPPAGIPPAGWEFLDDGAIVLLPRGTPFRAGALYRFSYRARNPPVAGIGYAATRDWIGFLRYRQHDAAGTANPLAPDGRHNIGVALAHGASQSGRFLRDMLYLGFNETEDLRIVFEGINPHSAAGRLYLNSRFAQPDRAYGLGYGLHGFPDTGFPFAYGRQRDPASRREDGLLERCRASDTCPKILHTVTSTEYWQGGHSLSTTDPAGEQDVAPPENVRIYHFAGTQHVIRPSMPAGVCSAPANVVVDPRPAMRALVLALDRWAKNGPPPPPSIYPKLADRTLVPATALQWPALPGFAPPHPFRHRVLVPAIDADGNEIAGLRLPEQAVPAASTTGWSLRGAQAGAAGELCHLDGIALPFAKTAAERAAARDPRPSLAERYQDRAGFLTRIRAAARDLQRRGYFLEEDVEKTVNRAARAW